MHWDRGYLQLLRTKNITNYKRASLMALIWAFFFLNHGWKFFSLRYPNPIMKNQYAIYIFINVHLFSMISVYIKSPLSYKWILIWNIKLGFAVFHLKLSETGRPAISTTKDFPAQSWLLQWGQKQIPCTYCKDTLSANMTNSISFAKTDLIWQQCPIQS